MDRVDFRRTGGRARRREKVALGAATAVAAGATFTAAAPAGRSRPAPRPAAIGGYKEWGALRAAANAHEVSAVAVRAAAEAEEILAGAERVKSVLPVCVVLGATATALSSSAPALLELVEPATAVEQIPEYYDEAPRWAPLQKYNTPTMEVPATQPLFVDRSAAVRSRTLVSLVCPAVSILAASVAVVAEQDSPAEVRQGAGSGRRRFATVKMWATPGGPSWSCPRDEAKADTALWPGSPVRFSRRPSRRRS